MAIFCSDCGSLISAESEMKCSMCGSSRIEQEQMSKLANLFYGSMAMGGKAYLTSLGVCFHPHKICQNEEDRYIRYEDIVKIEKCRTLGLVPNGVKLYDVQGQVHQFVMWSRDEFIVRIADEIERIKKLRNDEDRLKCLQTACKNINSLQMLNG